MEEKRHMTLLELRQVEMELLDHFRDFCREHRISYFISNGTLLGAVKYGGFIPWDDDIDLFVPRPDYDRLIREYADGEKFQLFAPRRVAGYGFPFAKLCNMQTRKEEENNRNGVDLGVDIDIFPLDSWGNTPAQARRLVKAQRRTMALLRLAKNKTLSPAAHPLKGVAKKLVSVGCKMLGADFFVRRMEHRACRYRGQGGYLGCVAWPVYGQREVLSDRVFASGVTLDFEGESLSAPVGYDAYLRSLYGDYSQDPPPEKQKTHHRFTAWFLPPMEKEDCP